MAATPLTPEWWRDRLLARFRDERATRIAFQEIYLSEQGTLPMLPGYADAYKRLLRMSRTPWPRLVVDIAAERLSVIGLHVDGPTPDESLWSMFGLSKMGMVQSQVYTEALTLGTSYVSVWPEGDALPRTMWESGITMVHEVEPGDPTRVAAAQKVWHDPIRGLIRANLYLPGGTYKWAAAAPDLPNMGMDAFLAQSADFYEVEAIENRYNQVPIIPFTVRPTWDGYGRSDLDDLIQIFARIENITSNILLAVELGAFRQRWATGLEVPLDPNTDEPIEPFKVALDRLWISEDEKTKFGSFEATDISGYLKAVSDAVGQLSAVSRIPVTYFVQSELANPPSAASFEASETGLINKVRERQEFFSVGWESLVELAMRMSGTISGTPNANVTVDWKDPRTRSESQTLDAAVKLYSIGTPWESVMAFIGYDPEEIKRMSQQRMADTFDRLLRSPLPQAPQLELSDAPVE
jgi:hypothetical protein